MSKPRIIEPRYSRDFTTEDTREVELTYTAKVKVRIHANDSLSGYDVDTDMVSFYDEAFSNAIEASMFYISMQDKFCSIDIKVQHSNVGED